MHSIDPDTDLFDSPEAQELFRCVKVLAQQNFPDTWKEMSYITQATGFILANGWTTLAQAHIACPQGLVRILTESSIISHRPGKQSRTSPSH
ncbi:hypothetical protein COCCU_10850 [Corynebacterium occultum]|uniref:Uncharacterized protein n=1 Tax=Corynebacterium occultum TaxID=2675219 RepID=A0A6B8W820_9CORY|nr:hypothetical protein [Corynebacterium occultum]QGU08087.1 hypothetical protein COCCU_10850 [Corynebacterium occultum]